MPAAVGLVVYRVVQEALTNVVRHSQATDCRVRLSSRDGSLDLSIADNGGGRSAAVGARLGGGLLGMRERLAMVGGSLALEDADPRGLRLVIDVPANPPPGIPDAEGGAE